MSPYEQIISDRLTDKISCCNLIVPWINIAVTHQTPTVIVVSMEPLDAARHNGVVNVKNIGKKRLGRDLKVEDY